MTKTTEYIFGTDYQKRLEVRMVSGALDVSEFREKALDHLFTLH